MILLSSLRFFFHEKPDPHDRHSKKESQQMKILISNFVFALFEITLIIVDYIAYRGVSFTVNFINNRMRLISEKNTSALYYMWESKNHTT